MSLFEQPDEADSLFKVETDVVQALSQVAFWGLENNKFAEAHSIARGLIAIRPKSAVPYIIFAVSCIFREQPVQAIKFLTDKAKPLEPKNQMVDAFLALALNDAGYASQASKIFESLINSEDATAAAMAKASLSASKESN